MYDKYVLVYNYMAVFTCRYLPTCKCMKYTHGGMVGVDKLCCIILGYRFVTGSVPMSTPPGSQSNSGVFQFLWVLLRGHPYMYQERDQQWPWPYPFVHQVCFLFVYKLKMLTPTLKNIVAGFIFSKKNFSMFNWDHRRIDCKYHLTFTMYILTTREVHTIIC